jgi:hypothetical protein
MIALLWFLLISLAITVHSILTAERGREIPGDGFERDPDA